MRDELTTSTPTSQVAAPASRGLAPWRLKGFGILRITFGIIWAIDAWFKWQPGFIDHFTGYLTGALHSQSPTVQAWITFWIHIVKVNPHFFAYLVAIGETAVALSLILGAFANLMNVVGILLSLVIWSTAEGFGGPYVAGSTDIGTAIIYVLVFLGLILASAGRFLGLDEWLTPVLGRWSFLATGPRNNKGR